MSSLAKNTKATVIPCLRYRNAPAAIEWLCQTFGFDKHLVVPGEGDTIVHAQLSFGNGMIMLGSVKESEFDRLMKQPDEIDGAETQSAYVIVSDADALYARARAAGAKIVLDIKDEDYGGRGFHVAISKDTSGISAPTIRGEHIILEGSRVSRTRKIGLRKGTPTPLLSPLVYSGASVRNVVIPNAAIGRKKSVLNGPGSVYMLDAVNEKLLPLREEDLLHSGY
jgi:uncharacterized glyoxalase superfamily protein PhnB